MRTFNYISVITINWTWVNNIWWQAVPHVKLIILSLCKKYFCISYHRCAARGSAALC